MRSQISCFWRDFVTATLPRADARRSALQRVTHSTIATPWRVSLAEWNWIAIRGGSPAISGGPQLAARGPAGGAILPTIATSVVGLAFQGESKYGQSPYCAATAGIAKVVSGPYTADATRKYHPRKAGSVTAASPEQRSS